MAAGAWAVGDHARPDPKLPAIRPLVVATLSDTMQDAMQQAFFGPFAEQTKIPVHAGTWDGLLTTLQNEARSSADLSDQSLVLMDNGALRSACQQGLVRPLDPALLPAGARSGPNALDSDALTPCGLGAFRMNMVLAWDKSRIDTAPGWAEFWDVARRPGKRGLQRSPRTTLEIALLADGVAPEDVYHTLGTSEGLDRAFRKLDQLKPYIVWWDTPEQAVHIIESGAVLMTTAPNDAVEAADLVGHRDFGIQWQQSLSMILSWAIPGRPTPVGDHDPDPVADERLAHAEQLLGFMTDPARQADFISRYPAVSLVQNAVPASQSSLTADSPATSEHLHEALREDEAFWAAHLDQIQARFDAWIGN